MMVSYFNGSDKLIIARPYTVKMYNKLQTYDDKYDQFLVRSPQYV